jgi:hypothetical protein
LGRTLGRTHRDHDKQEHHKKVADREDISLPPMQGIHNFTERRQTKWRYARIIHAPTICLGQKWQRTQVGKKPILVHNEVRQHTSKGPGSFLLGEGGDVGFLLFPVCFSVFSLCSNQDLNGFPTCSSSSQ